MRVINFGDYYIVNLRRNSVDTHHVDPEKLGRDLGVLRPWERVSG